MSSDPYGNSASEQQPSDANPVPGTPEQAPTPGPYGEAPHGQGYGDASGPPAYGQYPPQPYPYAQPGYGHGYYPPAGPGTDGLAIGALVSGILGLSFVPLLASIVAVVLGVMSLGKIKQTGQEGRGMAITGIVLGGVGVVLLLLAIVAVIVFLGLAAGHSSFELGNAV